MEFNFMYLFASAAEAWTSVPLVSLHLPIMGSVFSLSTWSVCCAIVLLVVIGNHSSNHSTARAGNSAVSGFRKSVRGFWNTQTLERVHLKWRQYGARSSSSGNASAASGAQRRNANGAAAASASEALCLGGARQASTNRLPAAWRILSSRQGKTTTVWLSVLFLVILGSNTFGLVPFCSRITGQAGFTLGASIALLSAITFIGVKRQGSKFVRLFLPSGPSWPMAPLFILLESISYGFRAISLGTRLYCNLFAGHLLLHLFTSLALAPVFRLSFPLSLPVAIAAGALLMCLSLLETLVVVLQSGVFCLLASFYLHEVLSRKDPLASVADVATR
uniref:ATP synthase subunit a n=1 Tax=Sphaeropleales sp. YC001 TaxID=1715688 RepID=A0A0N7F122_9CHLO|nr:ATPase subunit 6 [Sphaeropleales sp. YC001]